MSKRRVRRPGPSSMKQLEAARAGHDALAAAGGSGRVEHQTVGGEDHGSWSEAYPRVGLKVRD